MSEVNNQSGNNTETITEFEYALAGVINPNAGDSPAISVLGDIRELLESVDETPVHLAPLSEFLDGTHGKRRNDRRTSLPESRSEPPRQFASVGSNGGFVDITPEELLTPDDKLTNGGPSDPSLSPSPEIVNFHPDFLNNDHPSSEMTTPEPSYVDAELEPARPSTSSAVVESDQGEQVTEEEFVVVPSQDPELAAASEDLPTPTEPPTDFTETSEQPIEILDNSSEGANQTDTAPQDARVPSPARFVETMPIVSVVDSSANSEPSLFGSDLASPAIGAAHDDYGQSDSEGATTRGSVLSHGKENLTVMPQVAAITRDTDQRRSRPVIFAWVATVAATAILVVVGLWFINRPAVTTTEMAQESSDIGSNSIPEAGFDRPSGESAGAELDSDGNSNGGESSEFSKSAPSAPTTIEGQTTTATVISDDATTSSSIPPTSAAASSTVPASPTSVSPSTRGTIVTASSTVTTQPRTTLRATTTRLTTTTTRLTTTRRTTTTTRPTTTLPPTTTPPFAYIGNKVYLDRRFGSVSDQANIELLYDSNGDGSPEGFVRSQDLDDDGTYRFEVNAGCFVVRVIPFTGFELAPGYGNLPVCVESGETNYNIDSVIRRVVDPPNSCKVEVRDNRLNLRGVQVVENDQKFWYSYTFYDRSGRVVVETINVPSEDISYHEPTRREWEDQGNYDSQAVYHVAATDRDGNESSKVTCTREP